MIRVTVDTNLVRLTAEPATDTKIRGAFEVADAFEPSVGRVLNWLSREVA